MRTFLCFLFLLLFAFHSHADVTLTGSDASQRRQNMRADEAGLVRIQNDEELERFKQNGVLVPLRATTGLVIDPRLQNRFRYVTSWARDYLEILAEEFYKEFNKAFQINSAIRTTISQKGLQLHNKNAAPTTGDLRSSHLTGATVDIGKHTLTFTQIKWLQKKLLDSEKRDEIEATEEMNQAVFHIMVFKPNVINNNNLSLAELPDKDQNPSNPSD